MGSKFIINRRSSLDLHFILQAWTRIAQRKTRKYLFMVLAFQMKIFMVIAFQIKVLKLHTEDGSPPAPASSSSPYAAATVPPPPTPPSPPLVGVPPSPLSAHSLPLPAPSTHPPPWSPTGAESRPPATGPARLVSEHRRQIRLPRCRVHCLCKAVVHCLCRRHLWVGCFGSRSSWALSRRPWRPLPLSMPALSRGLRITIAQGSRSLLLVSVGAGSGLPAAGPTSYHPLPAGCWIRTFRHQVRLAHAPPVKGEPLLVLFAPAAPLPVPLLGIELWLPQTHR
jgi:hypothetical protein